MAKYLAGLKQDIIDEVEVNYQKQMNKFLLKSDDYIRSNIPDDDSKINLYVKIINTSLVRHLLIHKGKYKKSDIMTLSQSFVEDALTAIEEEKYLD